MPKRRPPDVRLSRQRQRRRELPGSEFLSSVCRGSRQFPLAGFLNTKIAGDAALRCRRAGRHAAHRQPRRVRSPVGQSPIHRPGTRVAYEGHHGPGNRVGADISSPSRIAQNSGFRGEGLPVRRLKKSAHPNWSRRGSKATRNVGIAGRSFQEFSADRHTCRACARIALSTGRGSASFRLGIRRGYSRCTGGPFRTGLLLRKCARRASLLPRMSRHEAGRPERWAAHDREQVAEGIRDRERGRTETKRRRVRRRGRSI